MTLTRQEMFDKALLGIRAQKYVRSFTLDPMLGSGCCYTGPNGMHCAIGHCLTEDQRAKIKEAGLNGAGIWQVSEDLPDIGEYVNFKKDQYFIEELQRIHDSMGSGSIDTPGGSQTFELAMKDLAIAYQLKYPERSYETSN